MKTLWKVMVAAVFILAGCGADPQQGPEDLANTRGGGLANNAPVEAQAQPPIRYHGGPLMIGTANTVYLIWYGAWSGNSATTILTNLVQHVGGTRYFNINTTYANGAGTHVSNVILYGGSTTDNYSHGKALSDTAVQAIVARAISLGSLPKNPHGIYFVLTSRDVSETSGFCTDYCGWHWYGSISGTDIKYAFVGNPARCPMSCEAQSTSPNGNPGADGMASILAHELEETVTDPHGDAWYDSANYENADKCAWTFGATSLAANGSSYNMTIGSRQYLIQQNWKNLATGAGCTKSY